MKVSPPHNLIVCALPPQSIVRHFVLAAVAHVTILCGAASAQSAPAAPPLSTGNAVELSYAVERDTTALLEGSADLSLWQPVAAADYSGEVIRYISTPADTGFFRLRVESRPEAGKSRWELGGARFVVNTANGVEILSFSETGGLRETAAGSAAFTWEWQRSGRDTGTVVMTSLDGVVATMDLQFTAVNSGVFTTERTLENVPVGTVSGTFRDDAVSTLAVSLPQQPESAVVTLSGTGRPMRIELDTEGNASVSNPTGVTNFTTVYTLLSDNSAELLLRCRNGGTELCTLTFTGPDCGNYILQLHDQGENLRRSAEGTFTIAPR